MGPAALVIDPVGVLGRSEDHEHDVLLLDVVEAVLDVRADEDHGPRLDRPILRTNNPYLRPARDDVVDLVLGVRTLGIRAARREHVHADRQVVGPDELVVQPPGGSELSQQGVELEGVHGSAA